MIVTAQPAQNKSQLVDLDALAIRCRKSLAGFPVFGAFAMRNTERDRALSSDRARCDFVRHDDADVARGERAEPARTNGKYDHALTCAALSRE